MSNSTHCLLPFRSKLSSDNPQQISETQDTHANSSPSAPGRAAARLVITSPTLHLRLGPQRRVLRRTVGEIGARRVCVGFFPFAPPPERGRLKEATRAQTRVARSAWLYRRLACSTRPPRTVPVTLLQTPIPPICQSDVSRVRLSVSECLRVSSSRRCPFCQPPSFRLSLRPASSFEGSPRTSPLRHVCVDIYRHALAALPVTAEKESVGACGPDCARARRCRQRRDCGSGSHV